MKLSDVMSAATGLSVYAEVALLIFVGVFLGVAFDLVASRQRHAELGRLPLENEVEPGHPRQGGRS